MWIAKPLHALSPEEIDLCFQRQALPLSQTICWQQASQATGAQSYLVLHTEKLIGGFVHTFDRQHFDCVNGPILNWDQPNQITSELATFAHAVSRLSRSFQSVTLAPRWESEWVSQRLSYLPISPTQIDQASTLIVPVESTTPLQLERTHPRMQRTLSKAQKSGVHVESLDITPARIEIFAEELASFGRRKGFYVPPTHWLKTLVLNSPRLDVSFRLFRSTFGKNYTQVLIALTPQTCIYLFGYDFRADDHSPSTSASAHFQVLENCRDLKVPAYDLNGFTDSRDLNHPYVGVSQFKSQFGGQEVRWVSPKFHISQSV